MKRSERHHLKANALAVSVARAQEALRRWRRELTIAFVLVAAAAVAAGGYFLWQRHTNSRAAALLAEAMVIAQAPVIPPPPPPAPGTSEDSSDPTPSEPAATEPPSPAPEDADEAAEPPFTQPAGSYPSEQARLEAALPKFLAAAEAYPSTAAAITARYHAAALLADLGRTAEAAQQYQAVVDRGGADIYAQMARLGLAETQMHAGEYERAIELLEATTAPTDAEMPMPVDAILMRLGHAYVMAGKTAEALQTFTRIVDEFPGSLYTTDAERELETLRQFGGGDGAAENSGS